ncbi:hypothetical protein [Wenyingzhuangia sp. IMCC45574]
MSKLKTIIGTVLFAILSSCAVDDDSKTNNTNGNGFHFNDSFFVTDKAFIKDFNTTDNETSDIAIVLSNIDPSRSTPKWGEVNYVYFALTAIDLEALSISSVPKYTIRENADFNNFSILAGNTILKYNDPRVGNIATSSLLTINSISNNSIDLIYEFTKPSGEIVSGQYKGTYTDNSLNKDFKVSKSNHP